MTRNRRQIALVVFLIACAVVAVVVLFLRSRRTTADSPAPKNTQVDGYSSSGDIFVMSRDGSDQTKLTKSPRGDGSPDWSPDGRKIAFVRERDADTQDIWIMNADGSGARRLTDSRLPRDNPAWSPDGNKIAFQRSWWSGREVENPMPPEIFVMDAVGTGAKNLTANLVWDAEPTWSPTGEQIAFIRRDDVVVMDANGRGLKNLSDVPGEVDKGQDLSVAWSPDGSELAFFRIPSSGYATRDVWVMNADGSDQRNLTKRPARDNSLIEDAPAWSPDGRQIAFVKLVNERPEIFLINVDGTGERNLTQTSFAERNPAWSPDGTTIAFSASLYP